MLSRMITIILIQFGLPLFAHSTARSHLDRRRALGAKRHCRAPSVSRHVVSTCAPTTPVRFDVLFLFAHRIQWRRVHSMPAVRDELRTISRHSAVANESSPIVVSCTRPPPSMTTSRSAAIMTFDFLLKTDDDSFRPSSIASCHSCAPLREPFVYWGSRTTPTSSASRTLAHKWHDALWLERLLPALCARLGVRALERSRPHSSARCRSKRVQCLPSKTSLLASGCATRLARRASDACTRARANSRSLRRAPMSVSASHT
jgi:hypothetical protein